MDLTYRSAGVDTRKQDDVMETVFGLLRQTWSDREHVQLDFGHFANVISIGSLGVAMSTDGIGTKRIFKEHPLFCQPVDGRCRVEFCQSASIGANCLGGVVIRHDEENVRLLCESQVAGCK